MRQLFEFSNFHSLRCSCRYTEGSQIYFPCSFCDGNVLDLFLEHHFHLLSLWSHYLTVPISNRLDTKLIVAHNAYFCCLFKDFKFQFCNLQDPLFKRCRQFFIPFYSVKITTLNYINKWCLKYLKYFWNWLFFQKTWDDQKSLFKPPEFSNHMGSIYMISTVLLCFP